MKKFFTTILDILCFTFMFVVGMALVHKLVTDTWDMLYYLTVAVPVALGIYAFVPSVRLFGPEKKNPETASRQSPVTADNSTEPPPARGCHPRQPKP